MKTNLLRSFFYILKGIYNYFYIWVKYRILNFNDGLLLIRKTKKKNRYSQFDEFLSVIPTYFPSNGIYAIRWLAHFNELVQARKDALKKNNYSTTESFVSQLIEYPELYSKLKLNVDRRGLLTNLKKEKANYFFVSLQELGEFYVASELERQFVKVVLAFNLQNSLNENQVDSVHILREEVSKIQETVKKILSSDKQLPQARLVNIGNNKLNAKDNRKSSRQRKPKKTTKTK